MPSIGGALMGGGLLAGAAGNLGGALIGSNAAKTAAGEQLTGIQLGITNQDMILNMIKGMMQPYTDIGKQGANLLGGAIGDLTKPFNPTMADLEATPGYQFTKSQGLQAVANAYSGQGLGAGNMGGKQTPSGPGIKGAVNYAEGLASTTYQQMFQNYLGQNAQIYNMYSGLTGIGESATAALGGVSSNIGSQISNLLSAGGAATAAGTIGSANALAGGLSGIGNTASNFALANALSNNSLFGNSGTVAGVNLNDLNTGAAVQG